jgi:hypothetical protein
MRRLLLSPVRLIPLAIVTLLLVTGCSGSGTSYSVGYGSYYGGSYYGGYYDPYPGRNYYRRDYIDHHAGYVGRPYRSSVYRGRGRR